MKLSAITQSAQTLDSIPTDSPDRIEVAAPVVVALTISLTGAFLVEVKYDVSGLKATAKPTPIAVSAARRKSCAYNQARKIDKVTVKTLDTSYERNMDSS